MDDRTNRVSNVPPVSITINAEGAVEMVNYQRKAQDAVVEYFNKNVRSRQDPSIFVEDTFVVWFCKVLQNWKALVSTVVPDGQYYEVTYDGDNNVIYLDVYVKAENVLLER